MASWTTGQILDSWELLAQGLAHSEALTEGQVNYILLLGGIPYVRICSFHKHLVNAFGARTHPKFIPDHL